MLRLGVIGCGYWGQNLVRNFLDTDGVDVVACADQRPDRLKYVRQRFPHIQTFDSWESLKRSAKIDGVVIATPSSTHGPIALEALDAGWHVLIEKPFTLTTAEAQTVVDAAAKRKLTLMVDFTFLYSGAIRKVKELITSGALGDVYYYDSSRINLDLLQQDTNVLWDLVTHDVSVLLHIMERRPTHVSSRGGSFIRKGIPELAYVDFRYADRFLAHITVSWLSPVKVRQTLIGGSKQMVLYNDIENIEKVRVYDKGVDISDDPRGLLERQLIYRTGDVWVPKIDTTEPLKAMCQHFKECIEQRKRPVSDGLFGLEIVKILEAAELSLKLSGQEVAL